MSDKSGESFQDSLNDWLVSIIVAVALAFCIRTFIFEPYKVEGTSMYPTLFNQERLIVNKIIYFLECSGIRKTKAAILSNVLSRWAAIRWKCATEPC